MPHWNLDDIPWSRFDSSRVTSSMIEVVKAAALVEYNGYDYARYLKQVFRNDPEFTALIDNWAEEEVQHGAALAQWAEMADPSFNFGQSFKRFTEGYKLPQDVTQSVRQSRMGELLARCVVEAGTSMYYTALREMSSEPVLQFICAKIAADEYRHYKLFYTHMQRYLEIEKVSAFKRLRIAAGRIAESKDDELAYAYFAANTPKNTPYERKRYTQAYMAAACQFYRPEHIERMTAMVLKAIGITPNGRIGHLTSKMNWRLLQWRMSRCKSAGKILAVNDNKRLIKIAA